MKKLFIFLAPCFIAGMAQAKTITLNIPDRDVSIVELDVLDAEQWIRDAWAGKLNSCKNRAVKSEIDLSLQDKTAIPIDSELILDKHLQRPTVKSRKAAEIKK